MDDPSPALQFERAETDLQATGTVTCSGCQQTIADNYYAAAGKAFCQTCRSGVEAALTGGSAAGRFVKAMALGIPAAILGALLYYAVAALTGYEFGLIAILIGFLVGGAVRRGSANRGGLAYQALAVLLTYCSIASTNVPLVLQALRQDDPQATAAADAPAQAPDADRAAEVRPAAMENEAPETGDAAVSGEVAIAMAVIVGLALAVPFLQGTENIMGLLIIAIGLYEAWKLNQRVDVQFTGPHRVGAAATSTS